MNPVRDWTALRSSRTIISAAVLSIGLLLGATAVQATCPGSTSCPPGDEEYCFEYTSQSWNCCSTVAGHCCKYDCYTHTYLGDCPDPPYPASGQCIQEVFVSENPTATCISNSQTPGDNGKCLES